MENERKFRVRLMSGLAAVGIAVSGYSLSSPVNAHADTSKYGVTYEEETGREYNTVIVEEGDTASKISSRIVHYFIENKEVPEDDKAMYNEDYNTRCKFWPVVVYLNTEEGKKYHSRAGAKFIFPKTYEELVELNDVLRKSGWLANYVQNNHIYPKKKTYRVPKEQTRCFLEKMYREMYEDPTIVVTDEMLDAYLRAHNHTGNFVYDKHSRLDRRETDILTEWILGIDELDEYMPKEPKHGRGR